MNCHCVCGKGVTRALGSSRPVINEPCRIPGRLLPSCTPHRIGFQLVRSGRWSNGPNPSTQLASDHSSSTHQTEAALPSVMAKMMSIALSVSLLMSASPAPAVLNSPNANIARSADAALRRSVPANNPDVKDIQSDLEEIAYLLRIPQRKPFGTMSNDVKDALSKFTAQDKLVDGVPANNVAEGKQAVESLYNSLKRLEVAVQSQQSDYIGLRVSEALKATADLELLQAPGLPYILPKEYMGAPRLAGRAVVRLQVERGGELAFVDKVNGGLTNLGTIEITLDGFSAPINSGRFLENVINKQYDDRVIEASRTAAVATTSSPSQAAPVPLEILPLGEFDPVYRIPLDVQGGELPVLPLSINGAVSFTHVAGNDSYLSGDDFFMYKFDKQQAGLGGLAFDEGTFAVFGYVTQGLDVMNKLQSGDRIVKAEVVSGADKLIRPTLS